MIVEKIVAQVQKELTELGLPEAPVVVEHPAQEEHGDYSSNVALRTFEKFKVQPVRPIRQALRPRAQGRQAQGRSAKLKVKTPRELAEAIANKLRSYNLPAGKAGLQAVKKIEVAGPGFINFWLSEHVLLDEMGSVINLGEGYGRNETRKGKKIMVEYTDPNPFKEFHIGHLYSNIVGESLVRLNQACGATVARANYQGDVGLHVAKALYGLLSKFKVKPVRMAQGRSSKFKVIEKKPEDLEKESLQNRVRVLGEAYAMGARAYDESEEAKREIEELNRKIYAQDPEILDIYEKGRQWSLEYFETIYRRLGTTFDYYYFERDAGRFGLEVVREGEGQGIFMESRGAVVFPGEKYGLHTRVFINSQGLPTYEAKDLGLAPTKYKDFAYDESIIVTGNEVDEYFKVVLAAMRLVHPKLGKRTRHISHGMVRLPGGKISSRTGEVLTGEWLLDEVKRRILKIMEQEPSSSTATLRRLPIPSNSAGRRPFRESVAAEGDQRDGEIVSRLSKDEVAEMVAIGVVKYALLRSSIGRDISFDFEKSISLEGDSGPYLQYTHARARSVLAKVLTPTFKGESFKGIVFNAEELTILRWLYRYPEVVLEAAATNAPSLVCEYLYELAQRYNVFYTKHRILQEKESQRREFRLALTAAASQVLKNGLFLLGVMAPGHM